MLTIKLCLPIRVAILEAEGLAVTTAQTAVDELAGCTRAYEDRYAAAGDGTPSSVEGIRLARSLFRALGIDPTKVRPSSEALLRRALKSKPLYAVNTLVDVCNWCSLDFLLPIGLYDRVKIQGEVALRQGLEGENYEGIGKPPVNVSGKYVLADELGPFGSPTSDSLRSCATEETTEAAMIIFSPADYPTAKLQGQAQLAADRIRELCGGYTTRAEVIDGT